jgi:serine/threonine protein kinase
MGPEQARGKRTDKRADIWAFGCILYEMLTGRHAFEGEHLPDLVVAVMTKEPDWAALPAPMPPRLSAAATMSEEGSTRAARYRRRAIELEEAQGSTQPTGGRSRSSSSGQEIQV